MCAPLDNSIQSEHPAKKCQESGIQYFAPLGCLVNWERITLMDEATATTAALQGQETSVQAQRAKQSRKAWDVQEFLSSLTFSIRSCEEKF